MTVGRLTEPHHGPCASHTPTERALAESTQRYHSLFVYNPHAAFSLDLEGRFEDANPAAERLAGYSREELREMVFTSLIHPEDLAEVLNAFVDVVNRVPRQLEARILHKSGRDLELGLTAMPVIVGDEVVGVHGVAEDVTERNEMRRELEAARRAAEEANTTKSLFLANMSHEIRTPLTSVLAATEMLGDLDLPAPGADFVEIIDRSGERLLRLVNDILDFSRLEAGSVELHDGVLSIHRLVDDVVEDATPMAEEKALSLTSVVDPALPDRLCGDGARISQVLMNLVRNAVKFTEEGHVRVSVDLVGDPTSEVCEVRFQVEDTGIGIPCDDLPTLFQSFTQADPSSTRRYDGAGLGLAICQELVTLMNGSIGAQSSPGAGSRFWFTLPLLETGP